MRKVLQPLIITRLKDTISSYKKLTIYVELKNPVESVLSLDDERVLIRSVDGRLLGALGMPFVALAPECSIIESFFEMYALRLSCDYYLILISLKKDRLRATGLIPDNAMCILYRPSSEDATSW